MMSQLYGYISIWRRKKNDEEKSGGREVIIIMLVNRFDTSLIIPYLINLGWRMLN